MSAPVQEETRSEPVPSPSVSFASSSDVGVSLPAEAPNSRLDSRIPSDEWTLMINS